MGGSCCPYFHAAFLRVSGTNDTCKHLLYASSLNVFINAFHVQKYRSNNIVFFFLRIFIIHARRTGNLHYHRRILLRFRTFHPHPVPHNPLPLPFPSSCTVQRTQRSRAVRHHTRDSLYYCYRLTEMSLNRKFNNRPITTARFSMQYRSNGTNMHKPYIFQSNHVHYTTILQQTTFRRQYCKNRVFLASVF